MSASFFSLQGQTALVTGGTRGIGQAVAIGLAEAGADIILVQVRYDMIPTHSTVMMGSKRTKPDIMGSEIRHHNQQKTLSRGSAERLSSTLLIFPPKSLSLLLCQKYLLMDTRFASW